MEMISPEAMVGMTPDMMAGAELSTGVIGTFSKEALDEVYNTI